MVQRLGPTRNEKVSKEGTGMKRSVIIAITVGMLLVASSMFATTVSSTNTNNVTATVTGGCQWITPLTMAFGNYNPLGGSALTQTTTVPTRCGSTRPAATW
jgi:hypothetical protein